MNFFEHQDIARRNARLLVLLFAAAVFVLILLTNALVAAFLYFGQDYNVYTGSRGDAAVFLSYFSWARFGMIGFGITATIAMVVLVKWLQLSTGGKTVALKTVGLLTVMASCGLPVPAEAGTALPAVDGVLAGLGNTITIDSGLGLWDAFSLGRQVGGSEIVQVALPVEGFITSGGAAVLRLGAGADDVLDDFRVP